MARPDARPRVLLVDNRDSFSHTVAHLLAGAGADVDVARSDEHDAASLLALGHRLVVVSPGPGGPADAGCSLALVRAVLDAGGDGPRLLGICLGLQCIAAALGAEVGAAPSLVHGAASEVEHDATGALAAMPQRFRAARYHSLAVLERQLPDALVVTARACDDGAVMAARHRDLPVEGVQFHPESVLTPEGHELARTWLAAEARLPAGVGTVRDLPRGDGAPRGASSTIDHHNDTGAVA